MSIVILGAGIAGLACADALVTAGHAVTLFDKGRAPGGRMATRRIAIEAGEAFFDHGAQYFIARDPDFRSQVLRWQAAGLAAPWPVAGPEAWVGTPSMAAPVRAMAKAHDVRFPVQIDAIVREGSQWHVDGAAFDVLAIALPAEQAAALLRPVQPRFADLAAQTPAAPCWTVMAAFPGPLPAPDILREDGPIGWAARNNAKPGRSGPEAWVVQASPDWSRAHLERSPAEIVPLLLDALASRLGHRLPPPLVATAHRWRYARSGAQGSGQLWDPNTRLGLCGDWLLGPRVEAAWLSGTRLAAAILASSPTISNNYPVPPPAGQFRKCLERLCPIYDGKSAMTNAGSQQQVRIIGRASSINVRKVLWTCREIGVAYTFDGDWEEDVRAARRAELLALNPNDQFPVLVDSDGPIWESNTICRYLAAQHGRIDLLPTKPRERASVEQWMDWQATDLNSAWRYAFMALVRKAPGYDRQSDVDTSVAAWNAAMTLLEHRLAATGAFVTGAVFTLADVVLGASVNRWVLTPMPKPELPAVAAYYERLGDRPGFVSHVRNGIP